MDKKIDILMKNHYLRCLLIKFILLLNSLGMECVVAGLSEGCGGLAAYHSGAHFGSVSPWGHVHMAQVCIPL
mgnify:CR=1 FL=1